MLDLNAALREVSRAETGEALWELMIDALKAEGIPMFSYHMVDAKNATIQVLAEGYPEDWVEEYLSMSYVAIDPIPDLASRLSEPFFWHDIDSLVERTPEIDAYLRAMDRAKLGDGLALYVFGPGLRNAYVGMGFGNQRPLPKPDEVTRLHLLAQAAHLRACALQDEEINSALSERELEVLRWIARGKSNSVIADILEISPHTVDAHLRSIYRKLDVTDRTSAAIRAVGTTLVAFPDPEGSQPQAD